MHPYQPRSTYPVRRTAAALSHNGLLMAVFAAIVLVLVVYGTMFIVARALMVPSYGPAVIETGSAIASAQALYAHPDPSTRFAPVDPRILGEPVGPPAP